MHISPFSGTTPTTKLGIIVLFSASYTFHIIEWILHYYLYFLIALFKTGTVGFEPTTNRLEVGYSIQAELRAQETLWVVLHFIILYASRIVKYYFLKDRHRGY
jgi:hypothetical protein